MLASHNQLGEKMFMQQKSKWLRKTTRHGFYQFTKSKINDDSQNSRIQERAMNQQRPIKLPKKEKNGQNLN